jgi:large subunit ribosomal protein L39
MIFSNILVKSGSFVHDISLKQSAWQPNKEELRTLSAEMRKLANKDMKIERLDVDHEMALEIFKENPFKCQQLPSISNQNAGKVTLYRMGDHVDISRGPMISSSSLLGKCTIAAVHEVSNKDESNAMYRVQGVALPVGFTMNHVAYGILEERARKLNRARLPNEPYEENLSHIELVA